jgi:hypothetical protein
MAARRPRDGKSLATEGFERLKSSMKSEYSEEVEGRREA